MNICFKFDISVCTNILFRFMIYRNNNILNSNGQLIEMMFCVNGKRERKERERWKVAELINVFPFYENVSLKMHNSHVIVILIDVNS